MINKDELWMLTASGTHFDLQNAKSEDIHCIDIAQSLARTCRFNGHGKHFYSVAEHILNGAKYLDDPKLLKYWHLHDAEEAYLGDIPTPLKKLLGPEFQKIQQNVHKAICERFDLPMDFDVQVKRNDHRMLLAERELLFDVDTDADPWGIDKWMERTGDYIDYEHVDIELIPIHAATLRIYNILKEYE